MTPVQSDALDFIRAVARDWMLILASTLLGLGLSAAFLVTQPVVYTASSESYISISSVPDSSTLSQGQAFAQQAATGFAAVAASPYVLSRVRTQLGLSTSANDLVQQVTAEAIPSSPVVQITATATNASLASGLANATAVQLAIAVQQLNPNVGNAASVARATQIATARTPTTPTSPDIGLDLVVGVVGGFGVGVVLVLVRELLNTRVRSVRQLARATEGVVQGVVRLGSGDPTSRSTGSAAVYRAIRTELLAGAVRNRLVVVASATPGRGSAVVAADVAASIARLGLRTLLLDAAHRTESARRQFTTKTEVGLWDVIDGRAAPSNAIVTTAIDHLDYLPPGSTKAAPADLSASLDFVDLMETLASRYDVIVASADPIGDATTTRSLAQAMDGILLVAELDSTTISEVRASIASIERSGVHLLGSVLVESGLERDAARRTARHGDRALPQTIRESR